MSITLNPGAGGATLAADQVAGTEYQKVKVTFSTDGVTPTSVDGSNGLPVNLLNASVAITAAALPLPTGAATAAKQPALGTAGTPSSDVISVQGVASMTALKVDGSGVTQPVSGTFWQTTQPVSASSLPLPSGASTAAKQPALGTAGSASADVITVQGAAGMTKLLVTPDSIALPAHQSVNVDQLNGNTPNLGTGTTGPGTLRVVLATDQPSLTNALPVSQSGTWTVQPGNTANTTPWLATNVPGTSPGSTASRVKAAASTNATSLKASAGVVLGYALYNNTASAKFFKFYNKASAPTVGTDTPLFTIIIPASGGANVEWSTGIPFSTGIAYAITGAVTDADTTATAADDVHGFVLWK